MTTSGIWSFACSIARGLPNIQTQTPSTMPSPMDIKGSYIFTLTYIGKMLGLYIYEPPIRSRELTRPSEHERTFHRCWGQHFRGKLFERCGLLVVLHYGLQGLSTLLVADTGLAQESSQTSKDSTFHTIDKYLSSFPSYYVLSLGNVMLKVNLQIIRTPQLIMRISCSHL